MNNKEKENWLLDTFLETKKSKKIEPKDVPKPIINDKKLIKRDNKK